MRSWADLKVPCLFGWQACEGEEDHGSGSVWLQRDHRGGVHDHVQQYGSESGKHLVKQTSSCLAMPFDLFMRIFVKARTSDDCEGRILQRNCSQEQLMKGLLFICETLRHAAIDISTFITAKGQAYAVLDTLFSLLNIICNNYNLSHICIFQVSEEVEKAMFRQFSAAAAAPPR